jgi:hypothetical protein
MKRSFWIIVSVLTLCAISYAQNGNVYVGNYAATSFQSGAVLPSSCYGSSVFTVTSTWLPYYCDAGVYVAFGTGAPATTAANLTNGSVGAQPYQTAASTTAFVYPATDAQMLTLDLNRTDSYTEDGTIERPYKNLTTLVIPSTGLASVFSSPNASYSTSTATTIPAVPLTIYGNNSTWTFSGGLTVNSLPTTIYDLNTVGAITYSSCGSTVRSERHGGSYSGGNVTLGSGCYTHFYGVNLSGNSNTLNVNGTLYGEALTGAMKIASAGSGALLAMYNPNMIKSSGYNIDMTSGGQLLLSGGLLNTVAGTANIYLPTANTASTLHAISGLITGTGTGVACVNGTTTYVAYGFNLAPITNCTLVSGYQGPTAFQGAISEPSNTLGTASTTTGTEKFYSSSAAGSTTLQATGQASNYTVSIPALTTNSTLAIVQYMSATATASQTTGLTAGSAILFTSIVASYGSDITLNTTTGVFTLASGHTYELRGAVPSVTTSNSGNQVAFQWYNITSSSYIGSGQGIYSPTSSGYNMAGGNSNCRYIYYSDYDCKA